MAIDLVKARSQEKALSPADAAKAFIGGATADRHSVPAQEAQPAPRPKAPPKGKGPAKAKMPAVEPLQPTEGGPRKRGRKPSGVPLVRINVILPAYLVEALRRDAATKTGGNMSGLLAAILEGKLQLDLKKEE